MLTRIGVSFCLVMGALSVANAQQVGHTTGNFTVSNSGSANYSIPVWVPPGVAGLQPSLALSYNSNMKDGLLGVGWSLSGLSSITRCNLTYAQDTAAGSPQLTSSDRFCLDGNRLRNTSGTYGADGTTYQTEVADFSNITSNGTPTGGVGPAWFKVQRKNGLIYEYGNTADSAIVASGSSSVRAWALNAVRDRNGNSMTFTYTNDTSNGSYRPASIQYTFTGSTSNGYSVVFTYQSRPTTDSVWAYTIGGVNNQANYLSSITVNSISGSTTTMVHGYELVYDASSPSGPNPTTTTNRLRIHSVQECASSTTDCFTATTITYQKGTAGWASEVAAGTANATNLATALPADINGDGIDDLVYADPASGHWYYLLGTTAGTYNTSVCPCDTGQSSATGVGSALVIDFDSDGSKEIMIPNSSGNWRVMKFAGTSSAFTYVDTTTAASAAGYAYVGDVDGDGRDDLVYAVSGGTGWHTSDYVYYLLNTGSAFSTTPGTLASLTNTSTCSPCVKLNNTMPFGNPAARYNSLLRTLDFNGDGKTDFLINVQSCTPEGSVSSCGTTVPIIYSWQIYLSQPSVAYIPVEVVHYNLAASTGVPPITADFNGDGCSDLAYTISNQWWVQYGTCGRAGTTSVLATAFQTNALAVTSVPMAIDYDGDGRADIVIKGAGASPDWYVALSTGNNFNQFVDTGVPAGAGTATGLVADINGDGLGDLVYGAGSGTIIESRIHSGVYPDLATNFLDAYGNGYSPTYVPLSNSGGKYGKGSSQSYPQQDYEGPMYVVPVYTATDGIGGTYTINKTYSSAVVNLQGRGFEGYKSILTLDSRNGMYEYHYFSQIFPTTGMTTLDNITQPTSTIQVQDVSNHLTPNALDTTANNQRYFPYIDKSTVTNYEVGGTEDGQLTMTTVTTRSAPDAYGNFPSVTAVITDNDPDSTWPYSGKTWTTTVANTYISPDITNWCVALPTQTIVTKSDTATYGTTINRTTSFVADSDPTKCRQYQQIVEPGSSTYKVTTTFSYDSFGNVNGRTVTGVGMLGRPTTVDWGASGQFPIAIKNSLNQTTHQIFDPRYGVLTLSQDPNGIQTQWGYDTFARKTSELRPDGTSTTWAYNSCTTAGCVNSNNKMTVVQTTLKQDHSVLRIDNTYLDTMDRTLVTSGQMLNGAYNKQEIQYDQLGRQVKQSVPCTFVSCSAYWVTNSYDILNRITSSSRPISATNSTLQTTYYGYQARSQTVKDPQLMVTTKSYYVTGALARTKDQNGYYINFLRDSFGSRVAVSDSQSVTWNTKTYAYGIGAFMVSSTDLDAGNKTYTVDALGETTAYTDNKSQNFSLTYDLLSRPLIRTDNVASPDLTTTWTWGNTAAYWNIGKLQSVSANSTVGNYVDQYTYDSAGRLTNRTTTLPTETSHAFDYAYDANTGLLSTVTYPTSANPATYRLAAGYTYAYGILQQIYDAATPSTIWWKANTTNARGQITNETTSALSGAPQIIAVRNYDAVTGWLNSVIAGSGGGAALQSETYQYDEMGNVIQRQDNNASLTENFYYDNLYRLCQSYLGTSTTPNLQMCYDNVSGACTENVAGPGNITSRSDVAGGAQWTYDATHKHNVTQAGDASHVYQYDFNGNIQSRNGSNIVWTSYNYPSLVQTSTESAAFDYGPDRQRWRMKYDSASGIETTFYVTRLFEKVTTSTTTDYRHYIYAANRPVMVISRTASATNVRSLLTNNQNSVSTIVTDSTGASYTKESFTAYGLRRDAGTWSGAPTSGDRATMDGVTREGYTFQTVLGAMGLNHMNGRVQDAVTGIFLSPDPKGGVAGNTQSWNLHNYVLNNPLSRVDPSGFEVADICYNCQGSYGAGGFEGATSGSLPEQTVTGIRSSFLNNWTAPDASFQQFNGGKVEDGGLDEITVTATRPPKVVTPPPTLLPIPVPSPDDMPTPTANFPDPDPICPSGALASALYSLNAGW